eukprot:TRINITY_DN49912_c0_g1_i1.p1 TRINITY_DN49912_c0_g1~~TRINITY_DN49912_c0_g1_i1.p1  ORF type:complete len:421 (-),score=43.67 TRINITY_DN49912_c0_g1_i1:295-1557(-)
MASPRYRPAVLLAVLLSGIFIASLIASTNATESATAVANANPSASFLNGTTTTNTTATNTTTGSGTSTNNGNNNNTSNAGGNSENNGNNGNNGNRGIAPGSMGSAWGNPYLLAKIKGLKDAADKAEADRKAVQVVADEATANYTKVKVVFDAIDADFQNATNDLNTKRAQLEAKKAAAEMARQNLLQAKKVVADEQSYQDDLDGDAQEAEVEVLGAAQDFADAQARANTTTMLVAEQIKICTEATNDARMAARLAAKLKTPEAQAAYLDAYNIKVASDRIMAAVNKQANRSLERVTERNQTVHANLNDKAQTKSKADSQRVVLNKAKASANDANNFFTKNVAESKALDAAVKVAGNAVIAKQRNWTATKSQLTRVESIKKSFDAKAAAVTARADASKANMNKGVTDATTAGFTVDLTSLP